MWSIQLGVIHSFLAGVYLAFPAVQFYFPPLWFVVVSGLFGIVVMIARMVDQGLGAGYGVDP